ncbi:MAG: hypothetical protein WDA71_04040 [Actinomycetota bacterium]
MEPNRQLVEIMSWRLATELMRRYPRRLKLIETHPGGGQYDCLALLPVPARRGQLFANIDLNRLGSAHFHLPGGVDSPPSWSGIWAETLAADDPKSIVDRLAKLARLPEVPHLPQSTREVLGYRLISAFLTHSALGRSRWECRNGYCDTSGHGGGTRLEWFERFPAARDRSRVGLADDFLETPAYRFWFLLQDDVPRVCIETTGKAWDERAHEHDLQDLYRRDRRIWPVVIAVAGHLLP